MHRQIGNAVPLPVAQALGRQLRDSLFEKWKVEQEIKAAREGDVIMIDEEEEEEVPTPRAVSPQNIAPVDDDDHMDDMYADY